MPTTRHASLARSPVTALLALGVAGLGAAIAIVSSIGAEHGPVDGLIAVIAGVLIDGAWAWAYLASAFGWGWLLLGLFPIERAREATALRGAVGLAALLTISHALGWAGWLAGAGGRGIGIAVIAIGLLSLIVALVRWSRRARTGTAPRWAHAAWLAAVPAIAVLLTAASAPPGWLWASEAGGYDALSYHLRLPQDWIAAGALTPVEHCVYSYLPGYVEAAMLHLAVASGSGPPSAAIGADPMWGLLEDGGRRLITTQMLHAGMALLAAWTIARLVVASARHCGVRPATREIAGALVGVITLATPWTVVVGSLAYNEMAMVALGASAMLVAIERGLRPWVRGVLVGLLVGAACGAKPTAMLFFTPAVTVLLVAVGLADAHTTPIASRARGLLVMLGLAGVIGTVMLVPWLARNAAHGGNPVFPAMTGSLGLAHWDEAQSERWDSAHRFEGGAAERLRLLVWPDPDDPAGDRHRGALHAQWAWLWPAGAIATLVACSRRSTRWMGLWVAAGLGLQLVAWLTLTHLQSRFLLPALAPIGLLIGLSIAGVGKARLVLATLVGVLAVAQTWQLITIFSREGGPAGPNAVLLLGPSAFTGAGAEDRSFNARAWLNFEPRARGRRTLVVGESATLYLAGPIEWTSTWDRSTLGRLLRAHGPETFDRTDRVREGLVDAGFELILVDWSELARLQRSGWHDPLITTEAVAELVSSQCELVLPLARSESTPWSIHRLRDKP
ncbi:MAG: hypothetical protein AAGK04_11665 [Planctomycetota bacterium]